MKTRKRLSYSQLWIVAVILITGTSCNNARKDTQDVAEETVVVEVVSEDIWLVDEHQFNNMALTSKAEVKSIKKTDAGSKNSSTKEKQIIAEEKQKETEQELEGDYEIVTLAALAVDLEEQEYEELASTVEVTEAIIPLEETQTVVSYAKKDKNDAAIQVVTNLQTGEIEQITFVDKKHQDIYDVQAGMSGKEARKLRREMKHMIKKGQVFLYDDQSNIMYLMDAQNMVGDEITVADVENMEVQSIIWKDKKHHKKNK